MNKIILNLLGSTLLLLMGTHSCYAVSLSTHKIHLNQQNRQYDFIIFNKESTPQNCEISLKPYTFDETGKSHLLENGEVPPNSADHLLRFSPRKFNLDVGRPQSVKFKLRVKRDTPHKEYRSYFAVNCQASYSKNTELKRGDVKIKPYLVHNIPIVARVGTADYTLNFSDILIQNKKLTFTLHKSDDYSTYGEMRLINKDTQEVISKIENVFMPIEVKNKKFSLSLPDTNTEKLQIVFIESDNYSKSKIIKFDIQ